MSEAIKKILILGSGSAGLLMALALKKKHPDLPVVVLRSKSIPIIGVGEGAVLDLNNHSATLNLADPHGEIRLGSGNLTLNGHIIHIYGDINGTGGLTLTGNTRITLSGKQTYTGATQLLSGKLDEKIAPVADGSLGE